MPVPVLDYRKRFGTDEDDEWTIPGQEPVMVERRSDTPVISQGAPQSPPRLAASPSGPPRPSQPPPRASDDAIERYQKIAEEPPPVAPKSGAFKTVLQGMLSRRLGEEGAEMVVHPKYSSQKRERDSRLQGAKVAADAQIVGRKLQSTEAERAANEEYKNSLVADREARTTGAKTKADDDKAAKEYTNKTNRFKAFVGGRPVDVRKKTDPPPLNSTAVPYEHPDDPDAVAYVPNAFRKATADLIESGSLPGYKEGEEVPRDEYLEALKTHRAIQEKKNTPISDPLSEFAVAIRAEGGDPADRKSLTKELVGRAWDRVQRGKAASHQGPQSLLFEPQEGGGYKTRVVGGGQDIPPGAVTAPGMNSINVPTSVTRAMIEKAPTVVHFVDRITNLLDENEKTLGPIAGRWEDFKVGKIGLKNRGYKQLATDMALMDTALMNMHVGNRGGEAMLEHFRKLTDMVKDDPDNLRGALQEIRDYAEYIKSKAPQGSLANPTQSPANPAAPSLANPPKPGAVEVGRKRFSKVTGKESMWTGTEWKDTGVTRPVK